LHLPVQQASTHCSVFKKKNVCVIYI
jgi:hypothetical protein